MSFVDIVFDGPPGETPGRFVEVENPVGHGISFGEWVDRGDGTWALRVPTEGQLAYLLRRQRELQVESFGLDPAEFASDEDRTKFISWNALALADELHEMLDEVGWKPWASSRHVNGDAALKELIDLFHFFMNLTWAVAGSGALGDADVLAETIRERYDAKNARNAERQAEGYDGVTGKCPHCRRAFDDVGVEVVNANDMAVFTCRGCRSTSTEAREYHYAAL